MRKTVKAVLVSSVLLGFPIAILGYGFHVLFMENSYPHYIPSQPKQVFANSYYKAVIT